MPPSARDYQPGERLPGTIYDVVRLIGSGGMGTVYDVEDTTIGKRYVLKTLHPQLGARADVARRMQKEARTLARLNHPNIVEVITAGVTGDELRLPYYVMERLNGQSLRVVLEKKGQLELPHAYHIGIDLLDALGHAHDKGVIHRDVKPDNIFLHRTSTGVTVTKLLDFGIVSLLDATGRDTAGRFVGTLRYAAPEQLRGERPTARVDIYAAGLVLYEMIAGRGPFDEHTEPREIGAAHLHDPPPPMSRFVPVPADLEALVLSALAKEADQRPDDAFAFASALRKLKRILPGPHRKEATTEDRATAPAVLGPEGAMPGYVEVRRPTSDGPYVIAPRSDLKNPEQTSFPKTTLKGMTPATVGPSIASPLGGAPTATTPDAIDRMAATRSMVADTIAAPRHGTDPLSNTPVGELSFAPTPSPPPAGVAPFRWPSERAPATSEEPPAQMMSLLPARSRRSARRVGAGVALGAAVLAAGAVVLAKHSAPVNALQAAATTASAALGPPAAPPPAPPAPPAGAAAGPTEAVATASVASVPKSRPAASAAARKPRPAATASASASASAKPHVERPGPGF